MTVWTDRMTFLNQYYSYAQMASDHDIPYRTVLQVKNTGTVPEGYQTQFKSLWNIKSYAVARINNVPVYSASTVRGGSLTTVENEIKVWNGLYDKWAIGAVGTRYKNYNTADWTIPMWQDFYTLRASIVISSQKSTRKADNAAYENLS